MSETDSADGGPADADADERGPAATPDKPVIEPLDDAPEGFEPV
ncbi:hypothetical protein [Nonomuraea zeae]|nr:hypothetical protein [Nonomuraea zeae]